MVDENSIEFSTVQLLQKDSSGGALQRNSKEFSSYQHSVEKTTTKQGPFFIPLIADHL